MAFIVEVLSKTNDLRVNLISVKTNIDISPKQKTHLTDRFHR